MGEVLRSCSQIRTTDHPSSFSLLVFARSRFTRSPLEYSDTLLIFLLKGVRPQKYRDNVRQEISGPDGSPLLPAKIIIECVRTPTMEEFDAKHQLPEGAGPLTA